MAVAGIAGAAGSGVAPRLAGWALGTRRAAAPTGWLPTAAATAISLGLVAGRVGWTSVLPAYAVFVVLGVALAHADLAEHRLPNRLTMASLASGVVLLAVGAALEDEWPAYGRAIVAAVVLFAAYLVLHLVAPRGFGAGDVKYAATIGLHLGWFGWATLVVGAFAAFAVGGVAGLAVAARHPNGLRARFAFGPAMLAGAVLAIALGPAAVDGWLAGTA